MCTPRPTELINFKSLKVHYMFQPKWPSSGVKIFFDEETATHFADKWWSLGQYGSLAD
jgi:hypothetical protein